LPIGGAEADDSAGTAGQPLKVDRNMAQALAIPKGAAPPRTLARARPSPARAAPELASNPCPGAPPPLRPAARTPPRDAAPPPPDAGRPRLDRPDAGEEPDRGHDHDLANRGKGRRLLQAPLYHPGNQFDHDHGELYPERRQRLGSGAADTALMRVAGVPTLRF